LVFNLATIINDEIWQAEHLVGRDLLQDKNFKRTKYHVTKPYPVLI